MAAADADSANAREGTAELTQANANALTRRRKEAKTQRKIENGSPREEEEK